METTAVQRARAAALDRFVWLARGSGAQIALATSGSLVGGAASALLVACLNQSLAAESNQLLPLGIQFAALVAVAVGVRWWSELRFAELRHATLARLRRHVSVRISALGYPAFEAPGASRLVLVMTQDVFRVSMLFSTLPRLASQGMVVAGCLCYLAWLSLPVFAATVTLVVVGALWRQRAGRRAEKQIRMARRSQDSLIVRFRELLAGAKELRLHAARRTAFLSEEVAPSVRVVEDLQTQGLSAHAAADIWGNLLVYLSVGGVVFGASALLGVDASVQSGYALSFLYMMHPLERLMHAVPDITRAYIAFENIQSLEAPDIGTESGAVHSHSAASEPPPAIGSTVSFEVHLRKISHRYRTDDDRETFDLGPIDFRLAAGSIVFLVGGNGSGKTTLAKVLVGLYEPEAGEVMLNGVRIERGQREAYRQSFSAIFSDHHVFESLVGLELGPDSERARELLDSLGLSHKVTVRDGAFSTIALSSGQRKRLALVVALLEDRPAYVFDEWAADQDPEHKRMFYERVLPDLRGRGKAVLVVTHDDEYFHCADQRVHLEAGRLQARS